jgi:predicted nucleic acid-binding protein
LIYFFDTSALGKYYHPEAGSDEVAAIMAQPDRQILISKLGFVEIQSVLAIKVRSGQISREEAALQRARLIADIAAGLIEVWSMTSDHFSKAEWLIAEHGYSSRLRTLDALQLAVALDLRSQGLLDQFVAADKGLLVVAEREGLSALNPEEPASLRG